eukprot:6766718-Pyramimonas_sp.AAC.1
MSDGKNGEKIQQVEGSELLQENNVLRGHAGIQELEAISMSVGLSRFSLCSGSWRIYPRVSRGLRSSLPPWRTLPRFSGHSTIQ